MPKYYMEVPVVMKLMIELEAEDKESAIQALYEGHLEIEPRDPNDRFAYIDYEWEAHEKVVQGNVYYGGINEIDIHELKDEEEDEDE